MNRSDYGYLLVATGQAEVMVDPVVAVWDLAPMLPILEEAGGTFTDWQGCRTICSGQAIATNGLVLDEVLDLARPSGAAAGLAPHFVAPRRPATAKAQP